MRAMIPATGLRRAFLGQPAPASPASFAVVVTDVKGDPFSGADVIARYQGAVLDAKKTDSEGIAIFTVPGVSGKMEIRVEAGPLVAERKLPMDSVNAGETLFVQLPVDRPEAILTPIEIGTLLLGAAAIGAGAYYKTESLRLAGEILLGAGIFTTIYRHGC